METDDETSTQDYGMRIYNPSLGKFLSVDPLTKIYPGLTPYQFASNTPIMAIDLDGLEASKKTYYDRNTGKTTIYITIDVQVVNKSKLEASSVYGEAFAIEEQFEKSYSGYDEQTKTEYVFDVNMIVGEMDEKGKYVNPKVDPNSHFELDIVDNVTGKSKSWVGKLMGEFGNTQKNRVEVRGERDASGVVRTGSHEIGHGLGLRHGKNVKSSPDPLGPAVMEKTNLMLQSAESDGLDITNSQRQQISDEVEQDTKGKSLIFLVPLEIKSLKTD